MEGVRKTKEVNINTKGFWNSKWSHHGGGERDDVERLKPVARKAHGSALDVGCAFGHLCKYLYERGCEPVVGMDFSVEAVKRAKKNYPFCMFVVGEATHLPFHDKCFNAVTLVEVIEHLTYFPFGFSEARRVLAKRGTVIFTVPDNSVYDEHVWTFTKRGVENIVKGSDGYVEKLAGKWWLGWFKT